MAMTGAAVLMQAELVLHRPLLRQLCPPGRSRRRSFWQCQGRWRVKDIDVNTVQNAAQLILLLAQQLSRPWLNPRVEDFLRVGRADGGDLCPALDGALHEVGTAVILHNMGVTGAPMPQASSRISRPYLPW